MRLLTISLASGPEAEPQRGSRPREPNCSLRTELHCRGDAAGRVQGTCTGSGECGEDEGTTSRGERGVYTSWLEWGNFSGAALCLLMITPYSVSRQAPD